MNFGTVGLHHDAPVGLLTVGYADHVDRAVHPELPAGQGERGAPLARAGLGGQASDTLLPVVEGLRDSRVRFVGSRWAHALILVEDVGRGIQELLQASGTEERSRTPKAVDLTHLVGNRDVGVGRDLLADDLLGEDRRERLGSGRLLRGRIERRL